MVEGGNAKRPAGGACRAQKWLSVSSRFHGPSQVVLLRLGKRLYSAVSGRREAANGVGMRFCVRGIPYLQCSPGAAGAASDASRRTFVRGAPVRDARSRSDPATAPAGRPRRRGSSGRRISGPDLKWARNSAGSRLTALRTLASSLPSTSAANRFVISPDAAARITSSRACARGRARARRMAVGWRGLRPLPTQGSGSRRAPRARPCGPASMGGACGRSRPSSGRRPGGVGAIWSARAAIANGAVPESRRL